MRKPVPTNGLSGHEGKKYRLLESCFNNVSTVMRNIFVALTGQNL
jgi:hypothetical protein